MAFLLLGLLCQRKNTLTLLLLLLSSITVQSSVTLIGHPQLDIVDNTLLRIPQLDKGFMMKYSVYFDKMSKDTQDTPVTVTLPPSKYLPYNFF